MKKLSGWQRIGIVLSVLWAVGIPLSYVVSENIQRSEARATCIREFPSFGMRRLEECDLIKPLPFSWGGSVLDLSCSRAAHPVLVFKWCDLLDSALDWARVCEG